jgi:hypothetical protein
MIARGANGKDKLTTLIKCRVSTILTASLNSSFTWVLFMNLFKYIFPMGIIYIVTILIIKVNNTKVNKPLAT